MSPVVTTTPIHCSKRCMSTPVSNFPFPPKRLTAPSCESLTVSVLKAVAALALASCSCTTKRTVRPTVAESPKVALVVLGIGCLSLRRLLSRCSRSTKDQDQSELDNLQEAIAVVSKHRRKHDYINLLSVAPSHLTAVFRVRSLHTLAQFSGR